MIEQPHLGIRIKELRENKGLTQKELSYQCNISERTLQRIENGYVKPRKYTLKAIAQILEDELNKLDSNPVQNKRKGKNYMKLLAVGTVAACILSFFYLRDFSNGKKAHNDIEQIISEKNRNFIQLINNGDIDAAMDFYHEDACIIASGCGKKFIRGYYTEIAENYRFTDLAITKVSVGDTVAVEKGKWIVQSFTGEEFKGEYFSEWKLSGDRWLITNEIPEISSK